MTEDSWIKTEINQSDKYKSLKKKGFQKKKPIGTPCEAI